MHQNQNLCFNEWKDTYAQEQKGDARECTVLLLDLIQCYVKFSSNIVVSKQFIENFENLFQTIIDYLLSKYGWVIVSSDVKEYRNEFYENVKPVRDFITSLQAKFHSSQLSASSSSPTENQTSTLSPR